jgi:integrase
MSNSLEILLKQQLEFQRINKERLGKLYQDNNMIFCREDGCYLDPDTVLEKYHKLTEKAKIKKCTFHALRYTFASRALESNISPKVVSQLLGHSSVQFTLDTYSHVLSELQISEMDKLDRYLNSIAV